LSACINGFHCVPPRRSLPRDDKELGSDAINQMRRFGTWFGFGWFMGGAVGIVVWYSGPGILSARINGFHCVPPRRSLPRGSERVIRSSIVMRSIKCVDSVLGLGSGDSWEGLWGPLFGYSG
jgi:hypothetical protein